MNTEKDNQSRLVIAIFIIGTLIAGWQLDFPKIMLDPPFLYIIGIIYLCFIVSSVFAIIFIITNGYGLIHKKTKIDRWIASKSVVFYKLAIKTYSVILLISSFLVINYFIDKQMPADSPLVLPGKIALYSTIFIAFTYRNAIGLYEDVIELYKSRKHKQK